MCQVWEVKKENSDGLQAPCHGDSTGAAPGEHSGSQALGHLVHDAFIMRRLVST